VVINEKIKENKNAFMYGNTSKYKDSNLEFLDFNIEEQIFVNERHVILLRVFEQIFIEIEHL
jgi:hypothetical protein